MKNLRLLSFPMLLLFIFSTQGCHKDVISEQDTQPATSDLVENFVSDSYFAQANKYYKPSGENKIQSRTRVAQVDAVKDFFISHTSVVLHLVNTIGYPVWNESITSENNGDELLILPFSKLDTNRMDAVMLIHRPAGLDSMYFKTIRRNELHNLPSVSALSPDANEKYTELSREFATTMVLYFEYAIFTEVDCELANTTFGNPLSEPILESRGERCYYVEYVQETQFWSVGGGFAHYMGSTYAYSTEFICNQIMDPGAFMGGGSSNWGYDPGGSTGSGSNNNENNAGPTLADCRQSNPEVLKRIFELNSQKLVSPCHNGRSINFDWNYIENELCKNNKYSINDLNDYLNNSLGGMDILLIETLNDLKDDFTESGININNFLDAICGQNPYDRIKALNECEKQLVEKYGNKIIFKLGVSTLLAETWTENMFGGNFRNDCSDAFRHAMLNATMSFYLGSQITKEFTTAHECLNRDQNHPEYFEGEMDLHNNEIGRKIYSRLPKKSNGFIPASMLAKEICASLERGELLVFSYPANSQSPLINSNNCKCN